jgi:hypothetical protein
MLESSAANLRIAREVVLGSGEIWRIEEGEEGSECARMVAGCVTGGKPGAEASWAVEHVFKVEVSLDEMPIRAKH